MSTSTTSGVTMPVIKNRDPKPCRASSLSLGQKATAVGLIAACTVAAGVVLFACAALINVVF